jgi:hypothetical protein
MNIGRLKGPAGGIRAWCARCSFLRIITGKAGSADNLSDYEKKLMDTEAAEIWESTSPPSTGDLCPRCMGDAWRLHREPVQEPATPAESE